MPSPTPADTLTLHALIAALRKEAPVPPGGRLSRSLANLGLITLIIAGLAGGASYFLPFWKPFMILLFVVMSGLALLCVGMAALISISVLFRRQPLPEQLAHMSDRRRAASDILAERIASQHTRTEVESLLRGTRLEIELQERAKLKLAAITALSAATIALAAAWVPAADIANIVTLLKQFGPSLVTGAALAWVMTLDFQDLLIRTRALLEDALLKMSENESVATAIRR